MQHSKSTIRQVEAERGDLTTGLHKVAVEFLFNFIYEIFDLNLLSTTGRRDELFDTFLKSFEK
jgi:hypothetical protein